ncbi:MAG: JAB domain-containing protein [Daejeonella sp.]
MNVKLNKSQKIQVNRSEDVFKILKQILLAESIVDRNKEHLWVIGLTNSHVIKYIELVSLGTLNATLVEPMEVFRLAVMKGVKRIMVAHNHPSENLEPSTDDLAINKRLKASGEILGIKLLDQLIISETRHISFVEDGIF